MNEHTGGYPVNSVHVVVYSGCSLAPNTILRGGARRKKSQGGYTVVCGGKNAADAV